MGEFFSRFVPPSARMRASPFGVPVLSGALVGRHAKQLGGPLLEITWRDAPSLAGVLRAARHGDALVTVGVQAAARGKSPGAARQVVQDVLGVASDAASEVPLVLLARAGEDDASGERGRLRQAERFFRDVDAGFTALAISDRTLPGDVALLQELVQPAVEQELGVELELHQTSSTGLLLAHAEDAGIVASAIRGASLTEDVAPALRVISLGAIPRAVPLVGLRIVIDDAVYGPGSPGLLDSPAADERVEARAYLRATRILNALEAAGSVGRLNDLLADEE